MDSSVVIKVKYGDTLRRFNTRIVDGKLDLSINGLREKIFALFSFPPETEIMLTYIDEDLDLVTLVDEEDLRDVVKQALNPLRITVRLRFERNSPQFSRSSGTSTPLRSPQMQPRDGPNAGISEILRTVQEPLRETILKVSPVLASTIFPSATGTNGLAPLHNLNAGISQVLRTVEEPLRGTLEKLSTDLASNSSTSATVVSEITDHLSKMSIPCTDQLSEFRPEVQPNTQNSVTVSNTAASEAKDLSDASTLKVPANGKSAAAQSIENNGTLSKEATMENYELKCGNVKKISSSKAPGFTATVLDQLSAAKNIPTGVEVKMPSNPQSPCSVERGTLDGSIKHVSGGLGYFQDSIWSQNPPCPASEDFSCRSSSIQKYGSTMVFHRNVQCDGCGVHPIAGPRFKSIVKVNYDLCQTCFSKVGNDSHYMRMDYPTYHPDVFGGSHDIFQNGVSKGFKLKSGAFKLNSRFIRDININDGTVMAPGTPFTKIWRMRNNGTLMWPQKTQLVWIGGDKLSNEFSVEVEIPVAGLPVDQELDVAVDFIAPELPGRYISYWRMASPSGQKFGQRLWVLIQVDASLEDRQSESVRGFNLNLLPVNSPEIINVDPEPMEEDSQPEPNNSKKPAEVVDLQPNIEHEMKFPINDSLLIGDGASSSVASADPPVAYPNIDVESALSSVAPTEVYPPTAPLELPVKEEDVEENLLKELQEMGFKQADLNKEILRSNNFDLDKSVEDLCDVSDWDPILEELKEMGFEDTLMNKMLLKRNNGSIKRVVMDLIAGE